MYTVEVLSKHVSINLLLTRPLHLLDTRNAFEHKGMTLVVLERIELGIWTCQRKKVFIRSGSSGPPLGSVFCIYYPSSLSCGRLPDLESESDKLAQN
jgi:hypothetical protein